MADAFDRAEKLTAKQTAIAKEGIRSRRLSIEGLCLTLHGRRFLWDLLGDANVFSSTYREGSFDGTAFLEGKRSSGIRLLLDIQRYCPSAYIQMTRENNPGVDIQEQDDDNG